MSDSTSSPHPDPDAWARNVEDQVLSLALPHVPQMGWSPLLVARAGAEADLSRGEIELLFPNGAADLAALLGRRHDRETLAILAETDPQALKIRERIRLAVETRLDAAAQDEAIARRWSGFLALPQNLPLASRLLWDSADQLWRWAGDTATDENHYSKRAILSGILSAALAIRVASGRGASMDFVDARIANVMSFEKWKATTKLRPSEALKTFAQTLGRMRYG
ncbi:COQ9 family protein [Phenylobacterium sp.]|uniref:COQ9 family protein n=1 Tax=Phenylobacterium sp. TaxID=1871053 RepID=UPI0027304147|nr:COQ9 family protein [Phenylobacterium sp.]MDP2214473.1 COQ9 family protein [Phenylobacterium sp.]